SSASAHQIGAVAAGAVQDEHRVADHALFISLRRSQCPTMNANFGQHRARCEMEVAERNVALNGCGVVSRRYGGLADQHQEYDDKSSPHMSISISSSLGNTS